MRITTDLEYDDDRVGFHDMVVEICRLSVSPHSVLKNTSEVFDGETVLARTEEKSSDYFAPIKQVVINATADGNEEVFIEKSSD